MGRFVGRGACGGHGGQGVNYVTLEDQAVLDSDTLEPVPADGETIGELMLRGNTVMRGYLKNPATTEATLPEAGCIPAISR